MKIQDLISKRAAEVITVRAEDTIETVAQILKTNNIGCLPVRNAEGGLAGILSERDLARSYVTASGRLRELTAGDLMTENVIVCAPDEDLPSAMKKLTTHHIRHLPIMDGDTLVGMISSRDVLEAVLQEITLERNVLRDIALATR